MEIPNITNFTPERIMTKEPFKRILPSIAERRKASYINGDATNPLQYDYYTQADFMREFDINSHAINSLLYLPDPIKKDEEGASRNKQLTRIALPFQKIIHTKRLDCLTGNGASLRIVGSSYKKDEKKYMELLDTFREYWEYKNIEIAVFDAIKNDGIVGDVAIGFFMANSELGYRLFCYQKGDILYPHYNPMTGKLALFGRKYGFINEKGEREDYLDVWDSRNYYRYRYGKEENETEEKWKLEYIETHNFKEVPIAYHRYGEPFWANSQDLIDKFELSISRLAENNLAYALRILYSFGQELSMDATLDGTPVQIQSSDPNSKVGFLEPADSSNSFALELKTLEENIYKGSFAVKTPELKSGADMSSLTVKMLFADSFQKAQEDSKEYQTFLDDVVRLFKYGLGIELGMSAEMALFKVKAKLYPYVFMSETEEVANLMQLKSVGGLSKRTLTEEAYEMGYGTIDEYQRVLQEEHDELLGTETNAQQNTSTNVINQARQNTNNQ